jgi:hypothetical protein
MGSQRLLVLTSKRTEISECLRLLEPRNSSVRESISLNALILHLKSKADQLDKRIHLELQESDPLDAPLTSRVIRRIDAA